jgi:hypothetical protein
MIRKIRIKIRMIRKIKIRMIRKIKIRIRKIRR